MAWALAEVSDLSLRVGDPSEGTGLYAEIGRVSTIPVGTIVPWIYTPTHPNVPSGWALCDGTNGTPNLAGKFLRGVTSRNESKEIGGQVNIPEDGGHDHGGATGAVNSNRITYDQGSDNNGVWFEHYHQIRSGGGHDHGGSNLPPYFTVMYIMKIE